MLSEKLLDRFLGRVIKRGQLAVAYPSGMKREYGTGGHAAAFEIRNARTVRRLLIDPQYAFGDAYAHGDTMVTDGTIYDLVALLLRNAAR